MIVIRSFYNQIISFLFPFIYVFTFDYSQTFLGNKGRRRKKRSGVCDMVNSIYYIRLDTNTIYTLDVDIISDAMLL